MKPRALCCTGEMDLFRSRLDRIRNLEPELVRLAKQTGTGLRQSCMRVGKPCNPHDGHTLAQIIPDMEKTIGNGIARIPADAGYRGHNAPLSHTLRVCTTGEAKDDAGHQTGNETPRRRRAGHRTHQKRTPPYARLRAAYAAWTATIPPELRGTPSTPPPDTTSAASSNGGRFRLRRWLARVAAQAGHIPIDQPCGA